MSVEIGKPAPTFTLPASGGSNISLEDYKGKNVVLYFYPKDDTPGCTKEACDFRDSWARVTHAGTVVLGVSSDSVDSHDKFKQKYDLPFPLLSDRDHKVSEAYGTWGGLGTERATFVIAPDGNVKAIFRKVKVAGHVDEVLEAVAK